MHTQPSATLSVLLRHYRERAGLTQETLAFRSGLTANAISALERGQRRHPYPHTVQALCAALDLDATQQDILMRLARTKTEGLPEKPPDDLPAILETISVSRSRRAKHSGLPIAPNVLIGRAAEYTATVDAVVNAGCRLLTLVGPGGAGKTRLALQVGADLQSQFTDGVVWLALAPVAAADLVSVALAEALKCPLHGGEPPETQVVDFLRQRDILLILDNFEHLLPAADLLATVLAHAPGTRLLVTSRERLRLGGEWVIELAGLDLPDPASANGIGTSPAMQLFAERARQVSRTFALTADNQGDVARICQLVDGMPLGIELAAAWTGTLAPADIADEVSRNLDFLHLVDRNAPPRHRSLRAVFDHSWNLLSQEERNVLARLAIFRGGCDRVAAAEVARASLGQLAALVDKSLIRVTRETTGTRRYDLHELLRQYALVQLQADPVGEYETREQHCAYYARQLGERTVAFLNGTAPVATDEVAADLDNIRQAWAWAVEQRNYQALTQMAQSLEVICEVRGLFQEGVALFTAAAEALRAALVSQEVCNPEIVWTLGHLLSLSGNRAARCGQLAKARDLLHEAHALLKQRGDLLLGSGTLAWLGYMTFLLGAYDEARAWLTESIALSRAHGHTFFLARSESILALVAQAQGAYDEALALARVGVEDWRANGHPCSLAMGLGVQSNILLNQEMLDQAEAAAREGLHLAAWLKDPWSTGAALLQLGRIALAQQRPAEGRQFVEESLTTFNELGDPWSRGRALIALGWVDQALGNVEGARRHFEEALHIARTTQLASVALDARFGLAYLAQADIPATLTVLKEIVAHPATEHMTRTRASDLYTTLSGDRHDRPTTVRDRGVRAATHRVFLASETGARSTVADPLRTINLQSVLEASQPEHLSERELQIVRLLAQGATNREIATVLVLAEGTVKNHLTNILGKLGARDRAQAALIAKELDMI